MSDLTELHQALAGVVLGGRGLAEVLTEIVGIARRAMPGAEASSITLIRGETAFTAASRMLAAPPRARPSCPLVTRCVPEKPGWAASARRGRPLSRARRSSSKVKSRLASLVSL